MLLRAAELTQQSLLLVLVLSIPALAMGALAGLVMGLLGAVTQVHDPAVTHLPRVLAVSLVLVVLGGAGAATVVRFTHDLWRAIPVLVR